MHRKRKRERERVTKQSLDFSLSLSLSDFLSLSLTWFLLWFNTYKRQVCWIEFVEPFTRFFFLLPASIGSLCSHVCHSSSLPLWSWMEIFYVTILEPVPWPGCCPLKKKRNKKKEKKKETGNRSVKELSGVTHFFFFLHKMVSSFLLSISSLSLSLSSSSSSLALSLSLSSFFLLWESLLVLIPEFSSG